ncbi:hypothetical protein AAVH_22011, partial [Aphelenchoides avenae]
YAISQFVGQLLSALGSLGVVVGALKNADFLMLAIANLFPVTIDILGLSGPICLLLT